jgi:hypothetical protein
VKLEPSVNIRIGSRRLILPWREALTLVDRLHRVSAAIAEAERIPREVIAELEGFYVTLFHLWKSGGR